MLLLMTFAITFWYYVDGKEIEVLKIEIRQYEHTSAFATKHISLDDM